MIIGINESKTLTKDISSECKCRFDGTKSNSNQWRNNDKCRCECKKVHVYEKGYVWNPAKCNCENGKYLASIIDDSTVIFDDVIESYDEEINSNENKAICKIQSFYILPAFLLITITSLFFYLCFCLLFSNVQPHFLSE